MRGLAAFSLLLLTLTIPANGKPPAAAAAPCQLQALDPETKGNIADALWLDRFDPKQMSQAVRDGLCNPQNSGTAFGERTRFRLGEMLEHPDSLTPDYAELYGTLAHYSKSQSAHQAYLTADLMGDDKSRGYRPIPSPAGLTFPHDYAIDTEAGIGWYYIIGNATGDNGKRYGILLMLFRSALLSPPVATHFGLTATENQTVDLQLAIAEGGDRNYEARPTFIAGTTGLLDFKADRFFLKQGNNELTSPPGAITPLHVTARGVDYGVKPQADLGIDLTFSAAKDFLLQGEGGCKPCCASIGTIYYSIPMLTLDPSLSTIRLKGETIHLVDGTFWLDHQKGTAGNPRVEAFRAASKLAPPEGPGWDFIVAQFQGNRQLTFTGYHSFSFLTDFFEKTGPEPPGVLTSPVQGKYIDASAVATKANGTLRVTDWVRATSSPDPNLYPVTNVWYPNKWELEFGPEVPADIRKFTMVPIVDGGSVLFFASGHQYQEAPVDILDEHGAIVGTGFAEATGFTYPLKNRLKMAGLPPSTKVEDIIHRASPTPALVQECATYLQDPQHQLEFIAAAAQCIGMPPW